MSLHLTDHAVEQYVARVKPALTFDQARAELLRFLSETSCVDEPPAWTNPAEEHKGQGYLLISDGICLVTDPKRKRVLTCLINGACSTERRAARKEAKRKRKSQKAWRNHKGKPGGHRRKGDFAWD